MKTKSILSFILGIQCPVEHKWTFRNDFKVRNCWTVWIYLLRRMRRKETRSKFFTQWITKMDVISQKSSDISTNTQKCTMEGCKNRGPFNTENLLSRHFKTAHSSVKFGCYKCERKFTDQAILFVHLSLNHSVEIPNKKQITLF